MYMPDWDSPSKDNARLCSKFEYDEFLGLGRSLKYRYFKPDTDKKVPLVLYLHGADACGKDNETPLALHDIGTMFARDEWQKNNPCYILAPQYKKSSHWLAGNVLEVVQTIVDQKIEKEGNIDTDRLYVYGYSAGGIGTFELIKKYPDRYAGAIPICGATYERNIGKRVADAATDPLAGDVFQGKAVRVSGALQVIERKRCEGCALHRISGR